MHSSSGCNCWRWLPDQKTSIPYSANYRILCQFCISDLKHKTDTVSDSLPSTELTFSDLEAISNSCNLMKNASIAKRRGAHGEIHRSQRAGWLRAAVLGADDAIVSTASLMIGLAASAASKETILVAGVAGLVA